MLTSPTEALDALARHCGSPGLSFDAEGLCHFEVGTLLEVEVSAIPGHDMLRLTVSMRVLGDADRSVLYRLLSANFIGQGTGKAAFCIDPGAGEILLTQALHIRNHTAQSFVAEVEAYLRHVLVWEEEITRLRPIATDAPAPPDDAFLTFRL